MTVLVTGAYGFIGRHLVRRLQQEPSLGDIVCVGRSPVLSQPNSRIKDYAMDLGETDPTSVSYLI